MFVEFFYKLKETGVPVSPTSFLTLHRALDKGLIASLDEFYMSARSILVKSERYFDLFDQVFAHHFKGAEMPDYEGYELDEMARAMLEEWLKDPKTMADALDMDEEQLKKLSPEELIEYFKERLKDRDACRVDQKFDVTGFRDGSVCRFRVEYVNLNGPAVDFPAGDGCRQLRMVDK